MNQEKNEVQPDTPVTDETHESELKDTVSWVLTVMLKFGAGYLTKMILDALGL